MASISIIGMARWGNFLAHCQVPLDPLHGIGEVRPCAWSSPYFAWRVRVHGPVHPRFLVRPRLLTRLYPLPAHRANTLSFHPCA